MHNNFNCHNDCVCRKKETGSEGDGEGEGERERDGMERHQVEREGEKSSCLKPKYQIVWVNKVDKMCDFGH